ncbi:hypothetical protein [Teichococcus vastitatis]|uniref:hypothetical protein n=1 Tax=Teichococcus vastitatis TaxID=2307076 RepID=UPI0013009A42|nr:hypothetical protein [Pseudoroseomonas vastitatis]
MSFPPVADPVSFDESTLDRATALGRRDGLVGQRRDIVLEGFVQDVLGQQISPADHILGAAFRHCYAAGHRHGAEVRRENEARRRRAEAPILSLVPGSQNPIPFRLLPSASAWTRHPVQAALAQAAP